MARANHRNSKFVHFCILMLNRVYSDGLIRFINASPSPYHAVNEIRKKLVNAGFEELKEASKWTIQLGKKYFLSRQGSAILAFTVPARVDSDEIGCIIGAAHVDSPCLRVRP